MIYLNSTKEPVYREEEEAFHSWWAKTPLGRLKQRAVELENEARIEKEMTDAKKKASTVPGAK